jgi:hypothetical protein
MARRSSSSQPGGGPVYRITAARTPLSADLRNRTRRYVWTMGIRTACLLGAIVAHGPARWALVVGAVLLPWVAVVTANAGRERDDGLPPSTVAVPDRPAIGPQAPPAAPGPDHAQ